MATKPVNIMHIEVKVKGCSCADGAETTITLDGDEAQQVLMGYQRHMQGGINNAFSYTDDDGNIHYIEYKCICGIDRLPDTQEERETYPCEDISCIPDTPPVTPES